MASESKDAQTAVVAAAAPPPATLGGAPLTVAPECAGEDDCVYTRVSDHAFALRARKMLMRVVFAARAVCEALEVQVLPGQAIVAAAHRVLVKLDMPCRVQCVYRTTPRKKAHTPEEQAQVDAALGQGSEETCIPYLVLLTPPLETFDDAQAAEQEDDVDAAGWLRLPRPKFVTLADVDADHELSGWCVSDCVHLDPRSVSVTLGARSAMLGKEVPAYLMYTPVYTLRPRGRVVTGGVDMGTDAQRVAEIVDFDAHAPDDVRRISANVQRMAEEDAQGKASELAQDNLETVRRMHAMQVAEDVAAAQRAAESTE